MGSLGIFNRMRLAERVLYVEDEGFIKVSLNNSAIDLCLSVGNRPQRITVMDLLQRMSHELYSTFHLVYVIRMGSLTS